MLICFVSVFKQLKVTALVTEWSAVLQTQMIRREVDFLKVNSQSAKKHVLRRSPSASALEELKKHSEQEHQNYRKGELPK